MVEAERLAASGCSSKFFGTGKHHVCSSSGFGIRKSISHRVLVDEFVRRTLRLICTEEATGRAQADGGFGVSGSLRKNEVEAESFDSVPRPKTYYYLKNSHSHQLGVVSK